MNTEDIDDATREMMTEAFLTTAQEAVDGSHSRLEAMREGIVAASMMLSAVTGMPDADARDVARKWAQKNSEIEF